MTPHGLSQNALARALGVPPRWINEIVLEKRGITAATASFSICGCVSSRKALVIALVHRLEVIARGGESFDVVNDVFGAVHGGGYPNRLCLSAAFARTRLNCKISSIVAPLFRNS
jgi:hypothetical protein